MGKIERQELGIKLTQELDNFISQFEDNDQKIGEINEQLTKKAEIIASKQTPTNANDLWIDLNE